jgi:hypothetical protein
VHDLGVMFAGEYIAGAAHVRRKLIHLIEATIDKLAAYELFPQIADGEIIRISLGERIEFEIDSTDPEAFAFQAFHQVATNETARTQNQSCLSGYHVFSAVSWYLEAPSDLSESTCRRRKRHGTSFA